jgi:hypothetical protein
MKLITNTALWLDRNTPYFTKFDSKPVEAATNPFKSIPFIPGMNERGSLERNTLPMNAEHCTTYKCKINPY